MTSTDLMISGYVAGTWDIDPVHTEIGFSVRHTMVSKVRGKFTKYTASLTTAENPLESHAEAEIDLSSITTGIEQRDNHLRSSHLFDGETSPKMPCAATVIRGTGDDLLCA